MGNQYVEFFVNQGDNLSHQITLTDVSTNTALNIASYSFFANAKSSLANANNSAVFSCVKLVPANGILQISLSGQQTLGMKIGSHFYKIQALTSNNIYIPISEGLLNIDKKI